jgi:hypothetical protein
MSDRPPRDPALARPADEPVDPWPNALYGAPQRPASTPEMLAPAFAFLGGAAAWALHLVVVYVISEIACKSERLTGTLFGFGTADVLGIGATVIAGLTALAAMMVALTLAPLRGDPVERAGAPERPGRERYLAFTGLVMNLLFTLAIINGGLPFMFLQACAP